MEKRTFDLRLEEENEIFLFEGDIFYGIKYTTIYPNQRQESIVYRWHSDESFWKRAEESLKKLLATNPVRFGELINFSKDEGLRECCKKVYIENHGRIRDLFKEAIMISNIKIEALDKITF